MESKGAVASTIVDSFNSAGVSWIRALKKGGENLLISPLSLSLALWMASQGANTKTFEEISSILLLPKSVSIESNNKFLSELIRTLTSSTKAELICSNSLWARNATLKKEFQETIAKSFDAEISPLESSQQVNNWVSKATKGKIASIGEIPDHVLVVLINALYFKGLFETPFDTKLTKPGKFLTGTGKSIDISFMNRTDQSQYYCETSDFSSIKLSYEGSNPRFECLLFLPKNPKTSPSSLLDKIFHENQLTVSYSPKNIRVSIPKFSVEFEESQFLQVLQSQGFQTNTFTEVANEPLVLTQVIHKTCLEMNETGTVAAAVTGGLASSALPEEFQADRPFLFILRDSVSQAILFLGEINQPAPLK